MSIRFDRLTQLANHLRTLTTKSKIGWKYISIVDIDRKNLCQSSGCALGHCTTLWPNDWQLYVIHDFAVFNTPGGVSAAKLNDIYHNDISPSGIVDTALKGAVVFFNVNEDQASHLFLSNYNGGFYSDVTPAMVADRIDEFIKVNGNMDLVTTDDTGDDY